MKTELINIEFFQFSVIYKIFNSVFMFTFIFSLLQMMTPVLVPTKVPSTNVHFSSSVLWREVPQWGLALEVFYLHVAFRKRQNIYEGLQPTTNLKRKRQIKEYITRKKVCLMQKPKRVTQKFSSTRWENNKIIEQSFTIQWANISELKHYLVIWVIASRCKFLYHGM